MSKLKDYIAARENLKDFDRWSRNAGPASLIVTSRSDYRTPDATDTAIQAAITAQTDSILADARTLLEEQVRTLYPGALEELHGQNPELEMFKP